MPRSDRRDPRVARRGRDGEGEFSPRRLVECAPYDARPLMNPDLSGIRGIVFDLDGTLIDSYEAIAQSLNHALGGLGRPALPVERIRTMVGRGLETLIAEALGGGDAPMAPTDPAVAEGVRLF